MISIDITYSFVNKKDLNLITVNLQHLVGIDVLFTGMEIILVDLESLFKKPLKAIQPIKRYRTSLIHRNLSNV